MSRRPTRRTLLAGGASAALAGPLLTQASAEAAPARRATPVVPGADVADRQGWEMLRGQRVGVVSNPTGVLADARHLVDSMAERQGKDFEVVGVFGPEHGFRGSAQAGESEPEFEDPRTGLTVYDAYGADGSKLAELFKKAGVQTVVFDIQDVGVRFYTYVWTMYHAMVAARTVGARFLVLDRPNPLGRRVDGPLLTEEFASGVGLKPIVQQHGMTVGELARYFNGELLPKEGKGGRVELEVERVRGLDPQATAQQLDLAWVPPSPNMPTPDTATAYAGTGYFEGTNLSEGRGTTQPFQFLGAPYLDYRYSDRLNALELPGVRFREGYFVPTFGDYQDETCAGVQLLVTDPTRYLALPTAVAMLHAAHRYDGFAWRKDADEERPYWIDKLSGSSRLRTMLDDGATWEETVAAWRGEARAFERASQQYLLY